MDKGTVIGCLAGLVICMFWFFLKSFYLIIENDTLLNIFTLFNIGMLCFSSYLFAKYIKKYGEEDE